MAENSQGHLAWSNIMGQLDVLAELILDAMVSDGISPAQYRKASAMVVETKRILGGQPRDNAGSYARYIARLMSQRGEDINGAEFGGNESARFFSIAQDEDKSMYRIDVTRVG